jgi:hypothetical protein
MQLEGLGQLKKIHLIGTRTRNLPACSMVPQQTTLLGAPIAFSKASNTKLYTNLLSRVVLYYMHMDGEA